MINILSFFFVRWAWIFDDYVLRSELFDYRLWKTVFSKHNIDNPLPEAKAIFSSLEYE